ncbi:hypothetical protein MKX08_007597 [Trichoderma sp. CBMAI-0020]|nr:hypothetical protein MKX08_007597 [Trichoderma sp. CBMAI-0020]
MDPKVISQLCSECQSIMMEKKQYGGSAAVHINLSSSSSISYPLNDYDSYYYEGSFKGLKLLCGKEDILPNLPLLQESSNRGCIICALLREAILGTKWLGLVADVNAKAPLSEGKLMVESFGWLWNWEDSYLPRLDVHIVIEDLDGASHSHTLHFEVTSFPGDWAEWLRINLTPPFEDPLSERAITTMKAWIAKCTRACHPDKAELPLPKRLIDVGNGAAPRLIETHTRWWQRHTPKYVALSYCWGPVTPQTLKTETTSLADRIREIPWNLFPKTIRDAILVTKALGLRYLWVDSLCIIQDDRNDWAIESSKMSDVYRNAYVTIIPFDSRSCDDGFLSRPKAPTADLLVQSAICLSVKGAIRLEAREESAIGKMPVNFLNRSSWRSRGWTFQEEQLSRRKLYFGRDRVIFACSKLVELETNARIEAEPHGSTDPHHNLKLGGPEQWVGSVKEHGPNYLYSQHWDYPVMNGFSHRLLTVPQDKLPALSGLAKTFHDGLEHGDKYLAGHWKSLLHSSMFWKPLDRQDICFDDIISRVAACPASYVAPTWSWVSFMTSRLTCDQSNAVYQKSLFGVIQAETVLLNDALPFGQISDGWLVLRGKCWSFGEVLKDNPRAKMELDTEMFRWKIFWDDKLLCCCYPDWGSYGDGIQEADVISPSFLLRLVLFPISTVQNDYKGLLLLCLEDQSAWVRVGVFENVMSNPIEIYGVERGPYGVDFWDGYESRILKLV